MLRGLIHKEGMLIIRVKTTQQHIYNANTKGDMRRNMPKILGNISIRKPCLFHGMTVQMWKNNYISFLNNIILSNTYLMYISYI